MATGLCFSRAMVGLGEGVAPSAATDMVARVIAKVGYCSQTSLVLCRPPAAAADGGAPLALYRMEYRPVSFRLDPT